MQEPFLGCIQYFSFNYAPVGYLACQGQSLLVTQYAALYSLLKATYGGNNSTNFNLPDYRGRAIMGAGLSRDGQNYVAGVLGGAETGSITVASLPQHTHTVSNISINASSSPGKLTSPVSAYPAVSGIATATTNYLYTATLGGGNMAPLIGTQDGGGAGLPFSAMPPFLALTCCIATVGIYPPHN